MKRQFILLLTAGLLSFSAVYAQIPDSSKRNSDLKNIIKFNVSSFFVYKVALLIEYERVLSKNQSFSIQAGFLSFVPFGFLDADSIHFVDYRKNAGYSVTGDYRFYLQKENKDYAPHGVYIGPYAGFLHVVNEAELQLVSGPNALKTQINVLSVGVELGYQFLLGKRWTLDFILIGPSITNYSAQMDLSVPIDTGHLNEVQQKVLNALASRFPVINGLVNNQSASINGRLDSWNAGFRYSMHVGFRF